MIRPKPEAPEIYVDMIAPHLRAPMTYPGRPNRELVEWATNQARLWVDQIWRHAFDAGVASMLGTVQTRYILVTAEERDRFIANISQEE